MNIVISNLINCFEEELDNNFYKMQFRNLSDFESLHHGDLTRKNNSQHQKLELSPTPTILIV